MLTREKAGGGEMKDAPKWHWDVFDKVALAYIGVIAAVFFAFRHQFQPHVVDMWYHLSIAKVIQETGQVPGWDWWELAPTGRPHLYPPLLHLLLAGVSWPSGDVIQGARLLQALFYPTSLTTTWYAARWISGSSRLALLTLLIASMDLMHLALMVMIIAACLVEILLPVLMVTVLAQRRWASIFLLTAIFYTHLGVPWFVVLGLLLFAWRFKDYRRLVGEVVGLAVLLYLPWLTRVLTYADWIYASRVDLSAPQRLIPVGPLALQNVHLVFIPAALYGLKHLDRRQPRSALYLWMWVGFAPFLLTYGGRFFGHTIALWSFLAALGLQRLLPPQPTRLRLAGVLALTLLPLPIYARFERFLVLPSFTAPHACLMLIFGKGMVWGEGEYRPDAQVLATFLDRETPLDAIIHTDDATVGDMLFVLTGRRTDSTAWWEVSKGSETQKLRRRAEEALSGVYVTRQPEKLPPMDRLYRLGRYWVGFRDRPTFRPEPVAQDTFDNTSNGWRTLSLGLAQSTIEPAPEGVLKWRLAAQHAAVLYKRWPALTRADGVRVRVRVEGGPAKLWIGAKEADGSEYRSPLFLAPGDGWKEYTALLRRFQLAPTSSDRNDHLDPAQATTLYFTVDPKETKGTPTLLLDEVVLLKEE
ncbi:MAG TPA: hypothetical protein EYP85_01120 [Armatimonadetes bacterium]|nr:hypothetical protein [Armatimonadota bacterium]